MNLQKDFSSGNLNLSSALPEIILFELFRKLRLLRIFTES